MSVVPPALAERILALSVADEAWRDSILGDLREEFRVTLIALTLAVMGLYSLMAFVVSRRKQELGVRMALGATRWQVVGLAATQGVKITAAGLLVARWPPPGSAG